MVRLISGEAVQKTIEKMATHFEDFASQAFRKHFADLVEAIQVFKHRLTVTVTFCLSQ